MKKILLICLVAVMSIGFCSAQTAKKATTTTVFTVDVDCDHCVKKIMDNIPVFGKGIKDVKVDLAAKEATIVYDPSKTDAKAIIAGFAKLKVKAEPKLDVKK